MKQPKTLICMDQAIWDAKIGPVNDELTEIEISCPDCMYKQYTFEQVVAAMEDLQAKQGRFLYSHFIEGGSVDAQGTITILVPHPECQRQFTGYTAALAALNATLQKHVVADADESE